MKKNNSPGSLPEIIETIAEAYSEARNFVARLSLARHYKVESQELSILCVFESDDEREELLGYAYEIERHKQELVGRSEDIRKHGEKLDQLAKRFGIAWQRITEICEFSYVEMGDFEDRSVTALHAIEWKFWAVKRWIKETIGFLKLTDRFPVALSLEESQKIQDLADGFPIDQVFLTALDKRLKLEKSVLTRNAKAYAESRGIVGTTTTPQGRKKMGKTKEQLGREKSFLDLLSEYEKWQDKQTKRSGPVDWLEDKAKWSSKSKAFFKERCGERDGTEAKIIKDSISFARKIWKQASGD